MQADQLGGAGFCAQTVGAQVLTHDATREKSVDVAARALFLVVLLNVGPIGDVEGRYYHRFAHRPLPDGVQEFPQIVQDEILQLLPLS